MFSRVFGTPQEERMTPYRKRRQMVILEGAMHDARMAFNERFLALREIKRRVVAEVNSRITRLREINAQLDNSDVVVGVPMGELTFRPEEVPEEREKVGF